MKNTERKFSKRHSSLAVYTLAFCVGTVLTYCYFFLYGKTLLWSSDGMLQHYPYLVKVKQIIGDFLCGNGLELWSWDTGLGADVIGNYATILLIRLHISQWRSPKNIWIMAIRCLSL